MATSLSLFLASSCERITDADEEAAVAFSEVPEGRDLGIIAKQSSISLEVAGKDFEIQQSTSLLNAARDGGTTGAVVWRLAPRLAEWLASEDCPLATTPYLSHDSCILEVGAGVAGIVAVTLSPKVKHYIASDQEYVLRTLRANILSNLDGASSGKRNPKGARSLTKTKTARNSARNETYPKGDLGNISLLHLDWDVDEVHLPLRLDDTSWHIDLVIGCDVVFNEAVTSSFAQTCLDVARSSQSSRNAKHWPLVVLIATEVRAFDVYHNYLLTMIKAGFEIHAVKAELLPDNLRRKSGMTVHLAILPIAHA